MDAREVGCPDTAALFCDIVEGLGTKKCEKTGVKDISYFLGVRNFARWIKLSLDSGLTLSSKVYFIQC